jgi:Mo-dependent nitrogenase C-terminus
MIYFTLFLSKLNILNYIRRRVDAMEISSPSMAHFICKIIPSHCPFEREIKWGDRTLFHIPPLCKLNPIYEQLVGLRFRSLVYLVDRCGEDAMLYS